jgi:S-adenosylmethionine:tRNA ribosyltransferase-isomerase
VVAVGTTVVRTLETAGASGEVRAGAGSTDLTLLPGAEFRVVTDLITNFHLPRSTLLMLVAAFAGRERVLAAYEEAIRAGYRFYSYGDAMLVRPGELP